MNNCDKEKLCEIFANKLKLFKEKYCNIYSRNQPINIYFIIKMILVNMLNVNKNVNILDIKITHKASNKLNKLWNDLK